MSSLIRIIFGDAVTSVDGLINHAFRNAASDIHMDLEGNFGYIKLRINGRICYYAMCERVLYFGLIGVIKSRAHMRIDVHDKGQDGSFIFYIDSKRKIFIRVSVNPTVHGESIVMRILDQASLGIKNLDELGMSKELVSDIKDYMDLENSLILISGATGSGKTTTMYAVINEIDPSSTIIISLEDPVEKHIPNVRQVSIRPDFGFGYADALRVALRQDPDVIVVGEIRDRETAMIAIEAALTGHLIIAGIHGRDSVDVILRLKNLGIDEFLISQTLSLSIHQKMIYKVNSMNVDFTYLDFFKLKKECSVLELKSHIKNGNVKEK